MRLFHRTSGPPDGVLRAADAFFSTLGLDAAATTARGRDYVGSLGAMRMSVRMEGGHYTLVEVYTDQVGESRLDKNVKKFFVSLHRAADSRHALRSGF
ncbi:hypothetical protein tb265_35340 [Gemmatimonadetes bacterium T265]|nr:hypothetical protein tb265_35340 [Gemmatimonadetes bacterium T265]